MADPLKAPNQTPLEADVRGRVLEAVSKGFLPESDDFFNFIGRGASYYKTKPASQRSMWDNLVRHSVFGGPDPNEIKAQTEQKAIIDYAKGIQKQFEGLPTAEEAGGFFKGGQLPFTPTMAQRQPIIPTPDEAAMLQRRDILQGPRRPEEQFQPLASPIQPGQVIGMDPTQFNPQAQLTPYQVKSLQENVFPGQIGVPPALAGIENRKVLPNEIESAIDVATGGTAKVPLPPALVTKGMEERAKLTHAAAPKGEDVHNALVRQGINPLSAKPEQVDMAMKSVQAEKESTERRQAMLKLGTETQGLIGFKSGFGLPDKWTEGQAEDVFSQFKKYQIDIERAKTDAEKRAILAVQQESPLDERAHLWLDSRGNAAKPTMSRIEAKQAGYTPVSEQQLGSVQNAKAALTSLADYKKLIDAVLVKSSGYTLVDLARVQGNKAILGVQELAGNPNARRFQELAANLAIYAKALGDTGNIAVAEQLMRLSGLPNKGDTAESAYAILNQLDNRLRMMIQAKGVPIESGQEQNALDAIRKAKEEMGLGKKK